MTTEKAAKAYLDEHKESVSGRKWAVFNPHGVDLHKLPFIYGFNNGGDRGFLEAVLMAEDGMFLGAHICSDEGYMEHDLGIIEGSRPDRHETFRKHYPDGYQMVFVAYSQVPSHSGLLAAFQKNKDRKDFESK